MLRFGHHFLLRCLAAWVSIVTRRAGLVLLGALLLTALLAVYAYRNMEINTDTDQMIDPDLAFRQAYDSFNAAFPQLQDSFIFVADGPTFEETSIAAKRLARGLRNQPGLFSSVFAPSVDSFFQRHAFLYLNEGELVALSEELAAAQPFLSALQQDTSLRGLFTMLEEAVEEARDGDVNVRLADILNDIAGTAEAVHAGRVTRLSWSALFNPEIETGESHRLVIIAQPVLDFSRLNPAREALDAARAMADAISVDIRGTDIRVTGKMALNADELKSVSEGSTLSGLASLLLVSLILGFGIRSARLVFAALLTLVMGLVWTGAFGLAAIGYFNIISIAFAVLFIGLGIDFAIHYILRYREEIGLGRDNGTALHETEVHVGWPLALCAPTTALAFYAFVPTDYAGLAQLGLISGTGMFISLFASLTILPAILVLLPLRPKAAQKGPAPRVRKGLVKRYGKGFAIAGLVLGGVSVFLLPQTEFQIDPLRLKDPETESVQAFNDLLEDSDTSPYAGQLVADSRARARAISGDLEGRQLVDRVVWLGSFVPADQDAKLGIIDDMSVFLMPLTLPGGGGATPPDEAENRAAVASLLPDLSALSESEGETPLGSAAGRLQDALGQFADGGADVSALETALVALFPPALERLLTGLEAGPVNFESLPEELVHRYRDADTGLRLEIFPAIPLDDQHALSRFVDDISADYPALTGSPVQIVRSGGIVARSMLEATLLAAVLIIGFLSIVLHRLSDVLLILAPVVLAGLMTAAATVLFNAPFNFANVIVLPLLIGLGVDSGIHIVLRAREKAQTSVLDSSTPRAVLLSSLTTIGSFGTLALSSHQGTASMGFLLTIAVLLTLFSTLLVLPGLLQWTGIAETAREQGGKDEEKP